MLEAGMVVTLESRSYRLEAPLAGSAYGLVWRASTLPTGCAAVLKFVNQAQMAQAAPAQRQRWIDGAHDEMAFLRQLAPWDGRHIVRLLDTGSHDGLPVLALESLSGDVGAWMARRRAAGEAPDVGRALVWIAQLNEALAKVHQYGRRYLDLKPSNLLLDPGGERIKLADFGTSRAAADSAPHAYAGTPNWQAPEQVFASIDHAATGSDAVYVTCAATDYFALGALLFYLVTDGVALRFCLDAAKAWREGQIGAAARLRAHHGGALPPTLTEEEAALFMQRCEEGLGSRAAAARALLLLRALVASAPSDRPVHALAIGRMLGAVMEHSKPIHGRSPAYA